MLFGGVLPGALLTHRYNTVHVDPTRIVPVPEINRRARSSSGRVTFSTLFTRGSMRSHPDPLFLSRPTSLARAAQRKCISICTPKASHGESNSVGVIEFSVTRGPDGKLSRRNRKIPAQTNVFARGDIISRRRVFRLVLTVQLPGLKFFPMHDSGGRGWRNCDDRSIRPSFFLAARILNP